MSTWVLLRGLTRDSRHWGVFPAILRETLADAEIVALDLPGNGRLNQMESPACVEQMADYCHAEMQVRGLSPPYFLLAMSLGAMVAVAWAQRHAHDIAGCVLINTSARSFSPFHQRLRPENYPALVKRALLGGKPADWETMILGLTSNRADASILDAWVAWRSEYPVSRRNALRQLWAASCFRMNAKPAPRLLILASTGDRLVNPRCSRRIALRWQTGFAEHPGAGHDIPLDDPCWVAGQVRDWLASISLGGRRFSGKD
jgi:pimeloyl-ACP methyl ester carboxylesterase